MNHIKIRYTFSENPTKDIIISKLTWLMCITDYRVCTAGFETKNKLGETTHSHIHFHCHTEKSIGAIRKAMQRQFKEDDEKRKGNQLYSCCVEEDVKDDNRFFRYPWKQGGRITREGMREPDLELKMEIALAEEEYARMVEFNQKKVEKSLAPNTFDKLEEYISNKCVNNVEDILAHIDEYYLENKLSMNVSTMAGYGLTLGRKLNLITKKEMIQKMLNKM